LLKFLWRAAQNSSGLNVLDASIGGKDINGPYYLKMQIWYQKEVVEKNN